MRIDTDGRRPRHLLVGLIIQARRCAVKNEPCRTCPWRRSSTVGGADIPRFDLDMMRNLRSTVGDGDGIRPIMACHYSPCEGETPCIGYVAVEGYSNIAIRLMAIRGALDLPAIWKACEGLDLWPSFHVMLEAYEAAADAADA